MLQQPLQRQLGGAGVGLLQLILSPWQYTSGIANSQYLDTIGEDQVDDPVRPLDQLADIVMPVVLHQPAGTGLLLQLLIAARDPVNYSFRIPRLVPGNVVEDLE